MTLQCNSIQKSKYHVFQPGYLNQRPMTFTFELVLDIINVNPRAKLSVHIANSSAVRMLTDRQNHRLD